MILPVKVQEVMVAYLKADVAVTAQIKSEEVRERQWVGDKFSYPNIRVHVGQITRVRRGCDLFSTNVEIDVFSETASSKEANDIAGVIAQQLNRHTFARNGVLFSMIEVDNIVTAENLGGIWHAKLTVSSRIS